MCDLLPYFFNEGFMHDELILSESWIVVINSDTALLNASKIVCINEDLGCEETIPTCARGG